MMTSLLVAVNKKNLDKFREIYPSALIQHNENDYVMWCKRTMANIQHGNQNIEDEE